MKVYVVTASEGSYDDYHSWIEKIFTNQDDANEFRKRYDKRIDSKALKIEILQKKVDSFSENENEWSDKQQRCYERLQHLLYDESHYATVTEYEVY